MVEATLWGTPRGRNVSPWRKQDCGNFSRAHSSTLLSKQRFSNLGRGLRLPSKKLFKKVHVPKSQKQPKTILSTYCIREGNFGSRGNSSVDVSHPFLSSTSHLSRGRMIGSMGGGRSRSWTLEENSHRTQRQPFWCKTEWCPKENDGRCEFRQSLLLAA